MLRSETLRLILQGQFNNSTEVFLDAAPSNVFLLCCHLRREVSRFNDAKFREEHPGLLVIDWRKKADRKRNKGERERRKTNRKRNKREKEKEIRDKKKERNKSQSDSRSEKEKMLAEESIVDQSLQRC